MLARLARLARVTLSALLLVGVGLGAGACAERATTGSNVPASPGQSAGQSSGQSADAPSDQPSGQPSGPAGELTANGKWFATERVYEGNCAPPGSRGGCHTITLRPDGTYRNFLYDAAIAGTYEIRGSEVVMTASDPAMPETLTLSADRTKLGELPLKR